MRKILQIASIALVLGTSTGLTVGFHYCGILLQDVAFFGKTRPCCEGNQMPLGCCHDEKVEIKSGDCNATQLISNLGYIPVLIAQISYPALHFSLLPPHSQPGFSALDNNRPPGGTEIVIRIQSLLI